EPSECSPTSGDGIGTESTPRAPPGPPRSERGRKRRAGGDPELPPGPRGAKRPREGDGGPRHSTTTPSDGDRLFAQKCRELRGFIRPLTELLNGLRMGRYDKGGYGTMVPSPWCPQHRPMGRPCIPSPNSPHGTGIYGTGGSHPTGLSSFQQSVAMDRIQRIIGVLQKPEMG
ncbi:UNVERIFIED_CONTAM: hypothetical protein H355_011474, partial [Colinus virginianus]